MSYYDYDDYYEPSEFDEKVEEFKGYLRESVKKETQELIEKLQKENAELREVRDNWESIKRNYENKKRELQREISNCKYEAARMRLEELFEFCGMNIILYYPIWERVYKPKCDKCDDNRYVHFKSPSGKDCQEYCSCAESFNKYKPEPYYCTEFRVNRCSSATKFPMMMWFKKYRDSNSDYDGYTYESSDLCTFIYNGEDFAIVESRKEIPYFRDEKQCQEYCDYLNKKNGITADMVNDLRVNKTRKKI